MAEKEPADGAEEVKAPARKLEPQTILLLANAVLTLAALGLFAYTKLVYQRPTIEEPKELEKKQEELKKPVAPGERPLVQFEQMILNIAMTSGKAHYATLNFTVECRDPDVAKTVNLRKPVMIDKLITMLGKRQITELNTIQGKLLLKSELMRAFNDLLGQGSISDLYFSTFILQ